MRRTVVAVLILFFGLLHNSSAWWPWSKPKTHEITPQERLLEDCMRKCPPLNILFDADLSGKTNIQLEINECNDRCRKIYPQPWRDCMDKCPSEKQLDANLAPDESKRIQLEIKKCNDRCDAMHKEPWMEPWMECISKCPSWAQFLERLHKGLISERDQYIWERDEIRDCLKSCNEKHKRE